jgi:tetratricopeptide (TPR) repeat protein
VDPVTTILSIVAIVGLVGLAVYLARRERLLSFCILWFLGNLVIESSVYGLEIIFEHRTYLPSMLVIVLAVTLGCRYIKLKWLGTVVVCGVVVMFSFWTYERNSVWSDHETLWRDSVAKSPKKARPHNNLAIALIDLGKYDEAIAHCREALRIKPNYALAHTTWGTVASAQGKLDEAISHYYEALRLDSFLVKAHNNLGNALFKKGMSVEAIGHYKEALRIKPDYALAQKNLQIALAKHKRSRGDIVKINKAQVIESEDPTLHYKLGNMYRAHGKLDEAMEHYRKALAFQPGFTDAMNKLALVHVTKGEYNSALPLYMRMIELQPDSFIAYYNMACMYAKQNMVDKSVGWLKQAVSRGFKDWDFLKKDKDLVNIRSSSYFRELTGSINHQ